MAVHMVLFLVGTLVISAITGILVSNVGEFTSGLAGQLLHGLLSVACFTLVGVAFWRFGWKISLIDLALVFIAGNVGFYWLGPLTKGEPKDGSSD
ncbi:MAG TPA: hypothetical protein VFQ83_05735 [Candidatus Udaeobacter sp.]|jgi:hypothetical protein|nr:hypothetical protein [Candidatus Udaeobacter sp.]